MCTCMFTCSHPNTEVGGRKGEGEEEEIIAPGSIIVSRIETFEVL